MILSIFLGAAGQIVFGPVGGLIGALLPFAGRMVRRGSLPIPSTRLVLLLLLVELRAGRSVLAAIQSTAAVLPQHAELGRISRVATVSGVVSAIPLAGEELRPVVTQLARAQRSGSRLTSTVRRLIEQDLAAEKARRLTRARSLPVRLMVPIALLVLPGLVLLLYAPALLHLFGDLTGAWS